LFFTVAAFPLRFFFFFFFYRHLSLSIHRLILRPHIHFMNAASSLDVALDASSGPLLPPRLASMISSMVALARLSIRTCHAVSLGTLGWARWSTLTAIDQSRSLLFGTDAYACPLFT
jgi:hypothetical protein